MVVKEESTRLECMLQSGGAGEVARLYDGHSTRRE